MIVWRIDFWKNRYGQWVSQRSVLREKRKQEDALIEEIDRVLAETKTKIPLVRNYRKKLREPVSHAIEALSTMIAQIPGPLALDPDRWEKEPVLNLIFSEAGKLSRWLNGCRNLRDAFERTGSDRLFGLLIADYKVKTSFGTEINGDIIRKNVQQQSVYFEDPRILVPATGLETARKDLRHRILVMLFTRELNEIAELKSWKEELEKQQDLLEFRLWGAKVPESEAEVSTDDREADEAKAVLGDIDKKIEEITKNLDTPESHLAHVSRALMDLRQHLRMENFTLRLNSLGKKVAASSSEPSVEMSLAECTFSGSEKRAAFWVQVKKATMNSVMHAVEK